MRDLVLIGADDVRSAGGTIARAAETMSSAASTISSALEQHQRFMEDWLQRFEFVIDKMPQSISIIGAPLPEIK
jgi:phosphoribosylpyrophosphate synthetase